MEPLVLLKGKSDCKDVSRLSKGREGGGEGRGGCVWGCVWGVGGVWGGVRVEVLSPSSGIDLTGQSYSAQCPAQLQPPRQKNM